MPINLGVAQGEITIGTSGVVGAERVVRSSSARMTKDLGGIGKGVGGIEDAFRKFDSFFGASLLLGAGVAIGRAAEEAITAASDLTESINKTSVAFASSDQEILKWSEDSATALGQSRQQALEGASSFGLLFSTMGLGSAESAKMSMSLVQLATDMASINNISPEEALQKLRAGLVGEVEPLRSVGVLLNATAVEAKGMEMGLANSTSALTEQDKVMARYQLILEQTSLTQGDFARTSGELANQQRILAATLIDTKAALGALLIPLASLSTAASIDWITNETTKLKFYIDQVDRAADALIRLQRAMGLGGLALTSGETAFVTGSAGRDRGRHAAATGDGVTPPRFNDEQIQVARDHDAAIAEIERDGNQSRLENNRDFQQGMADVERDYQQSVTREAQDFGIARQRQEEDFAASLLDIRRDAGRREAKQAEELARSIERSQADSAERIADARADTAERIAELDEEFKADQERRQQDFEDDMLSAAGRLDAVQLLELRKDRARQLEDEKNAHEKQRSDLEEQLQERIDDENEALAESIANAQEAHDRQLADAREADQLRIEDMTADFEERKALEDADRALRLTRMGEDHQDRLDEMARQHALDLTQIATQEAEKREKEQEEFEKALAEEGIRTDRWIAEDTRRTDAAVANLQRVAWAIGDLTHKGLLGTGALYGSHPSSAEGGGYGDAYTIRDMPVKPQTYNPVPGWQNSGGKTVNIAPGAIVINGDGLNEQQVVDILIREMEAN